MTIEDEARAEAERRYPSNHIVDDPFGATGEAQSDGYGYEEYARNAFIAGAEWQASRNVEPVDNAGDVLDATVRYAKSWRAEGGEVFGPSLMLDLGAMVREARAELAAHPGVAPATALQVADALESLSTESDTDEREALIELIAARQFGEHVEFYRTENQTPWRAMVGDVDAILSAGYRKVEVTDWLRFNNKETK